MSFVFLFFCLLANHHQLLADGTVTWRQFKLNLDTNMKLMAPLALFWGVWFLVPVQLPPFSPCDKAEPRTNKLLSCAPEPLNWEMLVFHSLLTMKCIISSSQIGGFHSSNGWRLGGSGAKFVQLPLVGDSPVGEKESVPKRVIYDTLLKVWTSKKSPPIKMNLRSKIALLLIKYYFCW